MRLLALAGSLSSGSLNHKLVTLAAEIARDRGATVDLTRLSEFEMPLYSQDIQEAGFPEGAQELRRRLEAADGLMLASPEYNHSIPGPLKNAIDWVSRFRPQPFAGLPGLLLSASPSAAGGQRGLMQLQIPLTFALGLDMFPRYFTLAQANRAFDAQGQLADADSAGRLQDVVSAFVKSVSLRLREHADAR